MSIEELAALVLAQRKEVIAARYSQEQAGWEAVQVIPGRVYTRIDRGPENSPAGFLMVEKATGRIFGIRGYGRADRSRCYGTLETVGRWFWGEYHPVRLPHAEPGRD